jgi:hypothetical protein
MQKKILLQILILAMIIGILIFFYQNYNMSKNTLDNSINANNKEKIIDKNTNNLIYNIEYIADGKDGINYIIKSKKGELNNDEPEQILMTKVTATINLKDADPIIISSDFALYNSANFDTKFYENVLMIHQVHAITSNNLDLLFEDNLATISNDVIYKNLNTRMQADKIEIDLITKNSKIFMDNKSEKVKIVNIN